MNAKVVDIRAFNNSLWGTAKFYVLCPISMPNSLVLGSRHTTGSIHTRRPALVAQRIEHLTTDQKVRGSNPFKRTFVMCRDIVDRCGER